MPRKIPFLKKQVLDLLSFFGYSLHKKDLKTKTDIKKNGLKLKSNLINSENPVIFDIGAYLGYVANSYHSVFPNAKIYCFEPFPASFDKLLQNMRGNSGVSCHNIAFSDKPGKSEINSNKFAPTNSLLETDSQCSDYWNHSKFETVTKEKITINTVDKFCEENGVDYIDIMKIDVQGMEFSVLEGARKMLDAQKISIIYFEVITAPTYVNQHHLKDYFNLLDSVGYEFLNFYNPVSTKKRLLQTDLLFASSELIENAKYLKRQFVKS